MKICLSLSLLALSLVANHPTLATGPSLELVAAPETSGQTTQQVALAENAPEILSGTTECWTGSPMGDLPFRLDHWGTANVADSGPAVTGLQNLLNFYSSNCQDITQFYVNGNIVGASFAGQMIQNHAFAVVVIQKLIDEVKTNGISSSKFIQYCPGDPAKSFGIILDTTGNIGALRSYVKSWSKGRCVSSSGTSSVTLNTWSVSYLGKSGNAVTDSNLAACDYVKVVSGQDTAAACGVTGEAMQLYNPNKYDIDGFDFDWEYPGAPDIPIEGGSGLVPYDPTDGVNYLKFITSLRAALPASKTLSIAAPASYWYLKNFPIVEMSQYLDYIVYMTYDFHGQWDYGNKYSQEGCPKVGMAAYGRSFKQTDPNCSGPTCTFTGPESGATPGECTNTAGYLSFKEIGDIYKSDRLRGYYYDSLSDSWITTYDSDQWISAIDNNILSTRSTYYQSLNLG
ncbi:hypothetical protein EV179_006366, partial [Coemansia sp. RSA 487]